MSFGFKLWQKPKTSSPAQRWAHDRRLIASWLQREAGGHFDGVETRGDGSTFIRFSSSLGVLSVHDYWSFARIDFDATNRTKSYSDALSRQDPVLTLGYNRPGSAEAELLLFLQGELRLDQGYAAALAPLLSGKKRGDLVALESSKNAAPTALVEPYSDPFLAAVIAAILQQSRKPPGLS